MDEQDHFYEGHLEEEEEEEDQTELHQVQRDEIVGVGYVEPEFGYYCGVCKFQKRAAVLMSKEDLIKHGTTNKGLDHQVIKPMIEGFVGVTIFEDRRVEVAVNDGEPTTPTLASSPSTFVSTSRDEIMQTNSSPQETPQPSLSRDLELGTARLADLPNTSSSGDEIKQIHSSPKETQQPSLSQDLDPGTKTLAASPNTLPSGDETIQTRSSLSQNKLRSQAANLSTSQDFDFGADNSHGNDDYEDLSIMGIDDCNRNFPISPPTAPLTHFQPGSSRVGRPVAGMTTSQTATGLRETVHPTTTTPRKSGTSLAEEKQDGAGMNGKNTPQSDKPGKTKVKVLQVMMTGVYIKPQLSDKLAGKRSFESFCNTFATDEYQPASKRSNTNQQYNSPLAFSPTPSSSGTHASFADGFNTGYASAPIAQPDFYVNDPHGMFDFKNPTEFQSAGYLLTDEEMALLGLDGFDV